MTVSNYVDMAARAGVDHAQAELTHSTKLRSLDGNIFVTVEIAAGWYEDGSNEARAMLEEVMLEAEDAVVEAFDAMDDAHAERMAAEAEAEANE